MVNSLATGNRNGAAPNAPDGNRAPQQQAPAMLVPFVRATDENLQPGGLDYTSAALNANTQDIGITNIPAYGYINCLYILVQATGGAAGLNNAVAKEDAPFSILRNIALTEPNGAIIYQVNDGWQAYLTQKYGGVLHPLSSDPKADPFNYSAVATTGNFSFLLRIPVGISIRDNVGALANQDTAGQFKLRMMVGANTDVYSTSPDTKPTVRVRAWLGSYDQPEAMSGGLANQVEPPAHGTTMFWTVQSGITVNSGQNTIELKRKGNYLRQILMVLRRSGSRSNGEADWPDETRFMRDAFPARYYNENVWRGIMFERTGFDGAAEAKNGHDNGLRFIDYMHEFDGLLGRENRDLWQPTRGSTRLEIDGSFGNAGTLDIITCDVAVASDVFL